MSKLEGKVAIVTGAGQGIGRGIALAFAKEGARVVIADRNPDTAKAVAAEIRALGAQALAVTCDVSNEGQVRSMVEQTIQAFGAVDILVNNAQAWGPLVPLEEMDEVSWDLTFNTGPKATWFCCRAVFPYMKDRGGKIINFGSRLGITGVGANTPAYVAAKEAIRAFSRRAAREWGKYNINVNIICPSAASPALMNLTDRLPDQVQKTLSEKSIRRWGDPEKDVGRTAVFLASEDSSYITGQTMMVDGGYHML